MIICKRQHSTTYRTAANPLGWEQRPHPGWSPGRGNPAWNQGCTRFLENCSHLPLFRTGVDPGFLLRQSQARDSGQEDRQEEQGGHGWAGVARQSVGSCPMGRLLYTLTLTSLSCSIYWFFPQNDLLRLNYLSFTYISRKLALPEYISYVTSNICVHTSLTISS